MKTDFRPTLAAFTASALLTLASLLAACGGGKPQGDGITILDIEAAIDNPKPFDLVEIAESIDFIPLDDSQPEALVGSIHGIAQTQDRIYVQDNGQEFLFKTFDRQGRFVSTLGRYGRGPDEFAIASDYTTDHDGNTLYLLGRTGDGKMRMITFDAAGRPIARNDSIAGNSGSAFFDGRLFVMKGSPASTDFGNNPDFVSSIGTRVPLLEIYSPDLRLEQTIETTDKGDGIIMTQFVGEGGRMGIMVNFAANYLLKSDGNSLMVKEARSDTVFYYRNGTLEPGLLLDMGKYAVPADALGMEPAVKADNKWAVQNIFESGDHILISARTATTYTSATAHIVIDRRNPAAGISATGGPEGKPGLFIDGIRFTPMYVHGGSLVGYMNAFDIVDNAESITRPDLKALAAGLREESNPVIVVADLK
jgi:hypothetical protein